MWRAVLCAALVLLVAAPPAGAATISLRDDLKAVGVAVAGPDVIVMRELRNGTTQLVAVPRAGGPARTLLSVPSVHPVFEAEGFLSASETRVAMIAEVVRHNRTVEWRVYSGPPTGPLEIVRRIPGRQNWEPVLVDVDGDRVLILEAHELNSDVRAHVLDAAFGLVPIAWTNEARAPLAIAGGHAAAYLRKPRRLAVVDLASGEEQAAIPLPAFTERLIFDLAADGRLVVGVRDRVASVRPGAAPTTVPGSRGLSGGTFAGDGIVAFDRGSPLLLGPDGTRAALGPPTGVLTAFAGDDQGFAWLANGCIRHASVPVTTAPQADDPCPTTEIGLYYIADSKLRGRTVRAPVRCITAPAGVCRGTLLGRDGSRGPRFVARGRFKIAVGKQRWVKLRIQRTTVQRFRRRDFGFLLLDARIPDGRIGVGADGASELSVNLG